MFSNDDDASYVSLRLPKLSLDRKGTSSKTITTQIVHKLVCKCSCESPKHLHLATLNTMIPSLYELVDYARRMTKYSPKIKPIGLEKMFLRFNKKKNHNNPIVRLSYLKRLFILHLDCIPTKNMIEMQSYFSFVGK